MTEDDKKRVTEWLGECWRPDRVCPACYANQQYEHVIGKVNGCSCSNRTFTTWDDFGACFDRLVELGQWERFSEWAAFESNYCAESMADEYPAFMAWLLLKDASGVYRLCRLIGEYLKKGVTE